MGVGLEGKYLILNIKIVNIKFYFHNKYKTVGVLSVETIICFTATFMAASARDGANTFQYFNISIEIFQLNRSDVT